MALPNKNQSSNSDKVTELLVVRFPHTEPSKESGCTYGKLYIDGIFECYTLEDPDWGLTDNDSVEKIRQVKKAHNKNCAIQRGTFPLIWTHSNKFSSKRNCENCDPYEYIKFYKKFSACTPEVSIKGWDGIRIHYGENKKWTEGCLLVFSDKTKLNGNRFNKIDSQNTVNKLYPKIKNFIKSGKVTITYAIENDKLLMIIFKNMDSQIKPNLFSLAF